MNNEKYLEEIKNIELYKDDNEVYHYKWDKLIQEILKENGFEDIAKEYDKAREDFWYA